MEEKIADPELVKFFDKLARYKKWLTEMDDPIAKAAHEKLHEFFKTTEESN